MLANALAKIEFCWAVRDGFNSLISKFNATTMSMMMNCFSTSLSG